GRLARRRPRRRAINHWLGCRWEIRRQTNTTKAADTRQSRLTPPEAGKNLTVILSWHRDSDIQGAPDWRTVPAIHQRAIIVPPVRSTGSAHPSVRAPPALAELPSNIAAVRRLRQTCPSGHSSSGGPQITV